HQQKSPGISAGASLSRGGRWTKRSGDRRRGVGGAEERTRTSTGLPPPDPESGVSANSTTSARRQRKAVAIYWTAQIKSRRPFFPIPTLTRGRSVGVNVGASLGDRLEASTSGSA